MTCVFCVELCALCVLLPVSGILCIEAIIDIHKDPSAIVNVIGARPNGRRVPDNLNMEICVFVVDHCEPVTQMSGFQQGIVRKHAKQQVAVEVS